MVGGIAVLAAIGLEGIAHAADAGSTAVDIMTHGLDAVDLLDLLDTISTLGLSVLLSRGVKAHFDEKNREKLEEIQKLTERSFLIGRLARALTIPNCSDVIKDCLDRLGA